MQNKVTLLDYYDYINPKLHQSYLNFLNICNMHKIRCNLVVFHLYFLLFIYFIFLSLPNNMYNRSMRLHLEIACVACNRGLHIISSCKTMNL